LLLFLLVLLLDVVEFELELLRNIFCILAGLVSLVEALSHALVLALLLAENILATLDIRRVVVADHHLELIVILTVQVLRSAL